jgi:hypothetical protein
MNDRGQGHTRGFLITHYTRGLGEAVRHLCTCYVTFALRLLEGHRLLQIRSIPNTPLP